MPLVVVWFDALRSINTHLIKLICHGQGVLMFAAINQWCYIGLAQALIPCCIEYTLKMSLVWW